MLSFVFTVNKVSGQSNASASVVFDEADSLNDRLQHSGIRVAEKRVVAWFPRDSLSGEQMQRFADTLNKGVAAIEAYIHAPLPWQVYSSRSTYTFYFRPDKFISHASSKGYIAIPFCA